MEKEQINLADYEDYFEERSRGGGGGKKKKKATWGSEGRQKSKGSESRRGQQEGLKYKRERGERSPVDEVSSVIRYLFTQDVKLVDRYIDWLAENINEPEDPKMSQTDLSNWEQFTASVKAGGGGRQTSRNARARTHLLTGIRAAAEESRQGEPNEEAVMEKLRLRLIRHLNNWRVVLELKNEEGIARERLEEEVLERMTRKETS